MVKVKHFKEGFEADLQKINAEIKEQKESPMVEKLSDQEIVKQSLEKFSEKIPEKAINESKPNQSNAAVSVLPGYLEDDKNNPAVKTEVERLVKMVFNDSLEKAIKEAKRHQPFILDAFHDALVEKLLPELKKRGIIK